MPAIVVTLGFGKVDLAQQVILGVGHVERVAAQGHALRMVELAAAKSPLAAPIGPIR